MGGCGKTRLALRLTGPVTEYFLFTLAVMAYHFGRMSLVAFLVNPMILPAQALLMVLGGVSIILGWVSPVLGKLSALLAYYAVLLALTFGGLAVRKTLVRTAPVLPLVSLIVLIWQAALTAPDGKLHLTLLVCK